ncbi:MAG: type II secretion system F family protein [Roseburia sp.]|nr:type II secretion system F family protein [Roseburia sp.]
MIDYNRYVYTKRELVKYGLGGGIISFVILMLFYDHALVCMLLAVPAAVLFLKIFKHSLIEKRRWQLTVQFKDAMESLVSAMAAGYSLENAVGQAKKDLALMYSEDDIIRKEFEHLVRKLELKVPVEKLLGDLGMRSGVEDIILFGEILVTAKKTGGNIVQVMRRTSANISEKIEMKREIDALVSGKKMESRCMTAVPLLMIVYLRIFSPGFLDPLYRNPAGAAVMTGALLVYAGAFLWGQRIMKIDF